MTPRRNNPGSQTVRTLSSAGRGVWPLVLLLAYLSACVAPGSSGVEIRVKGRITMEDGRPLANEEVELVLPASYGLGGLDTVVGEPSDYGHVDQENKVTTDSNGEFKASLGFAVYHIDHVLVPPLGSRPKRPPAPFFWIRVPRVSPEQCLFEPRTGRFKVFEEHGGEIPPAESQVARLTAREEYSFLEDGKLIVGVVELSFRAPAPTPPDKDAGDWRRRRLSRNLNDRKNRRLLQTQAGTGEGRR